MFFLALLKLVEIVEEAAGRVSVRTIEANPLIPWREIVGTRNHLVHGYDAVDHRIPWDVVEQDFPPLVQLIEKIAP